ncbi:MAG: BlaI/MecI/CopY family transcriptional regulator [Calditrichaeota bacterium]|nr:MAG: BlaI/MecI/CopY family transcriptional regulator [Calditrichota bacterium]
MKPVKKIADAEWEIMNCIWEFSNEVTVREVHSRLYPKGEKAYTTVQTIMNILVDKGYLEKKKIGMVNFYKPTKTREEVAREETRSLVSKIFGGSFLSLAHFLVNSHQLSEEEMKELKALIDAREKNQKKSK